MDKISVIVPVYNSEENLRQCINSILNQTYSNLEVILVDDGSKDKSGDICDEYMNLDDRVKVIHKENEGVSLARNDGILNSSGVFITFVDSDDYLEKDFLKQAINKIENYDLYISGIQMEYFEEGKIVSFQKYGINNTNTFNIKNLFERLNTEYPQICICGPWCKLYRASIIKNNHIQFNRTFNYGEDTLFNIDYLSKIKSVFFDSNIFYHYRRENENSLFSQFHPDTYEVHEFIYNKMRDLMINIECSYNALQSFENLYAGLMIGCIHQIFKNSNKEKEKKKIINKVVNNKYIYRAKSKNIKTSIILYLIKKKKKRILYYIFLLKYKGR